MIPKYIQPFLWSYDIKKMDIKKNKKRIITNVLNLGSAKATFWLFKIYSKKDIKKAVINPMPGEWNDKSLNFWSLIFNIPAPKKIFVKLNKKFALIYVYPNFFNHMHNITDFYLVDNENCFKFKNS
ncbi:MAG: hypothetical protein U9M94_01905 [Patescibacteria group bacterium]|nr:hypothetical protein [Patescibacteria group bacterium]